jgi:hypothetical protein
MAIGGVLRSRAIPLLTSQCAQAAQGPPRLDRDRRGLLAPSFSAPTASPRWSRRTLSLALMASARPLPGWSERRCCGRDAMPALLFTATALVSMRPGIADTIGRASAPASSRRTGERTVCSPLFRRTGSGTRSATTSQPDTVGRWRRFHRLSRRPSPRRGLKGVCGPLQVGGASFGKPGGRVGARRRCRLLQGSADCARHDRRTSRCGTARGRGCTGFGDHLRRLRGAARRAVPSVFRRRRSATLITTQFLEWSARSTNDKGKIH